MFSLIPIPTYPRYCQKPTMTNLPTSLSFPEDNHCLPPCLPAPLSLPPCLPALSLGLQRHLLAREGGEEEGRS